MNSNSLHFVFPFCSMILDWIHCAQGGRGEPARGLDGQLLKAMAYSHRWVVRRRYETVFMDLRCLQEVLLSCQHGSQDDQTRGCHPSNANGSLPRTRRPIQLHEVNDSRAGWGDALTVWRESDDGAISIVYPNPTGVQPPRQMTVVMICTRVALKERA